MADTGSGATYTLASTGSVGVVRSITLSEQTKAKIEDSDLSTTDYITYIFSDLAEPGSFTLEVVFDPTVSAAIPSTGTVETGTVTSPIHTSGNTTNANMAGTGAITSVKPPDYNIGELQIATIEFSFDGKTGPTWTAESA